MLHLMGFAITLAIALAAGIAGYTLSRRFVSTRLRFVDAAQSLAAPVIAGLVACIVALPVVAVLPFVGGGTALIFGASVAAGVMSGAKDIRRQLPPPGGF